MRISLYPFAQNQIPWKRDAAPKVRSERLGYTDLGNDRLVFALTFLAPNTQGNLFTRLEIAFSASLRPIQGRDSEKKAS